MKNILDNRVVIVDVLGNVIEYPYEYAQHQDCYDDFQKRKGYEFSNVTYLARRGNAIFQMMGNDTLVAFLSDKLNEEQLYKLDYIVNWFYKVRYLEVGKVNEKEQIIEQYKASGEDVIKTFEDIIQSYYSKKNKGK